MSRVDVVRAAMVEAMKAKRQSKKRFLIHAVIRTEKCGDRQAFPAD